MLQISSATERKNKFCSWKIFRQCFRSTIVWHSLHEELALCSTIISAVVDFFKEHPSADNKRGGKLLSGPDRVTFVIATIIYSSSSALFLAPRFLEPRDQTQPRFFLEAREKALGTSSNIQTIESHHSTKVNFAIFLGFSCRRFHVNGVRVKASLWGTKSKQLQWSEILEYRALRQISGNQQRWTLWTSSCKKGRKLGQTLRPLSAKTTIWSTQLLKRNQSELKEELWLYLLYLVLFFIWLDQL